ncbi:Putative FAD-binding domain, phenol hydroxylase dimerization domain, Thioredoxin-like superfamily [Septoria linicola]|uniref:FAD-binding domain, phenol hydroxylase dimerization domain, Thioredoxin-like superfamily n=1 Tax=Septoria linicola TaxID=215465 RepID=A0A9Q9ASD7_9PEZI|nr:putative FAD-binding domain, phenol hydroxylase dimerization domain, Thioredoxin-like superfamily [Septoria linicola]USW51268.1 Putative FAD-binding domain, phenol hydroxylase dimerization domain, Thioredoxin-like superfamily [Septoria linicola]
MTSKRHSSESQDHTINKSVKLNRSMSPGILREQPSNGSLAEDIDVVIVGAGPAGLMLAANLVRFGIRTTILDNRADKTATGRADGLQPKTIETLRQMCLAGPLLERGAKVHDICFWSSSAEIPLRRTGREVHYPPAVDLLDPYILLVHQGMVEEVFLDDLQARGVEVQRNSSFISYEQAGDSLQALRIAYLDKETGAEREVRAQYLVGCDGAHSQVRRSIPGAIAEGSSSEAIWGVLDGEIVTDFPDLWSKAVVYSHKYGNILCIPRERDMTRLYIELKSEDGAAISKAEATQEYVMERARQILQPFQLSWSTVEWFGIYQIGQRVANRFTDDSGRVLIAGDASHTHSPKAAQGMNTSMHDSLNLAWKLNLVIRGLAKEELITTYESERRKIARDLINFDLEHANAFHDGDIEALTRNFLKHVRFISGIGVEYEHNLLNTPGSKLGIQPGCLPPPARVTRYIDANPVDIQLDIPMLGQFKVYFFCPNLETAMPFLAALSESITQSLISGASAAADVSYQKKPASGTHMEEYVRPERYTAVSKLFTFALVTGTAKSGFELAELPPVFQKSRWTVYLDDLAEKNTKGKTCTEKWVGALQDAELAILNVRPDGYVATVRSFDVAQAKSSAQAASWLQEYYAGFLAH